MCDENRRQAGEMKITENMIEVGVAEFTGYDSRVESAEDVVIRIFRSMVECSAPPKGSDDRRTLSVHIPS